MRHYKYGNGDKTSLVFQNGSNHLSLDQRNEILKTFEGLFGNVSSIINVSKRSFKLTCLFETKINLIFFSLMSMSIWF